MSSSSSRPLIRVSSPVECYPAGDGARAGQLDGLLCFLVSLITETAGPAGPPSERIDAEPYFGGYAAASARPKRAAMRSSRGTSSMVMSATGPAARIRWETATTWSLGTCKVISPSSAVVERPSPRSARVGKGSDSGRNLMIFLRPPTLSRRSRPPS